MWHYALLRRDGGSSVVVLQGLDQFLPVPRTGFQGLDRRFAEIAGAS